MIDGRTRRWAGGLAAVALVLGNLLLHKPVSEVCDALFARLGREDYERLTLLGIGALSVAGIAWALRRHIGALAAPRARLVLVGLALSSAAAQRWLLVSNVELIHLPQFGLLAAILMWVGLSPAFAWCASTAAGVLDEGYQRLVIYPQVPNVYFDWNDIVLNGIGAAWAVVALADCAPAGATSGRTARHRAALGAGLAALISTLWLAPPRLSAIGSFPFRVPSLERALTGRDYHVMSASEGIAALMILWWLVNVATIAAWPERIRQL